jgi:hypothetical protein
MGADIELTGTVTEYVERNIAAWDEADKNKAICTALRIVAAEADEYDYGTDERKNLREAVEDVVAVAIYNRLDLTLWEPHLEQMDDDEWVRHQLDGLAFLQKYAPYDDPIQQYTGDDLLAVMEAELLASHTCGDNYLRVLRMVLARVSRDHDAYGMARDEIDDCPTCLGQALNEAVWLHANDLLHEAGSFEGAEALAARAIARRLGKPAESHDSPETLLNERK